MKSIVTIVCLLIGISAHAKTYFCQVNKKTAGNTWEIVASNVYDLDIAKGNTIFNENELSVYASEGQNKLQDGSIVEEVVAISILKSEKDITPLLTVTAEIGHRVEVTDFQRNVTALCRPQSVTTK